MRWIVALAAAAFMAAPASAKPEAPAGFRQAGGGSLVHVASGTVFPKALAGFDRAFVEPMDHRGHDVIASYRYLAGGAPVIGRVALLHVEMMTPREHFAAMKPLVGSYFRGVRFNDIRPLDEGELKIVGERRAKGWQGHFAASLHGRPYELSLSTVDFGYWKARLTAAYPASEAKRARQRLRALALALIETGPDRAPTR